MIALPHALSAFRAWLVTQRDGERGPQSAQREASALARLNGGAEALMLPLFPDWPGTPLTAVAVRTALRPLRRSFTDNDPREGLVTLLMAAGTSLERDEGIAGDPVEYLRNRDMIWQLMRLDRASVKERLELLEDPGSKAECVLLGMWIGRGCGPWEPTSDAGDADPARLAFSAALAGAICVAAEVASWDSPGAPSEPESAMAWHRRLPRLVRAVTELWRDHADFDDAPLSPHSPAGSAFGAILGAQAGSDYLFPPTALWAVVDAFAIGLGVATEDPDDVRRGRESTAGLAAVLQESASARRERVVAWDQGSPVDQAEKATVVAYLLGTAQRRAEESGSWQDPWSDASPHARPPGR